MNRICDIFKNKTEKVLKLMSDLGLLGILIPDFKRISGQMQFGGFHTYTVDEHTLKAIGYIYDIEMKKNLKENLLYSNIFSEIISWFRKGNRQKPFDRIKWNCKRILFSYRNGPNRKKYNYMVD